MKWILTGFSHDVQLSGNQQFYLVFNKENGSEVRLPVEQTTVQRLINETKSAPAPDSADVVAEEFDELNEDSSPPENATVHLPRKPGTARPALPPPEEPEVMEEPEEENTDGMGVPSL